MVAVRRVDASKSSADFESAVSRICNPHGVTGFDAWATGYRPAECDSAIQQIENLRYRLAASYISSENVAKTRCVTPVAVRKHP